MLHGFSFAMGGWGILGMVFFWAVFLILLFWGMKLILTPRENSEPTPKSLLDKRYVNGEISKEEYTTMKNDISR